MLLNYLWDMELWLASGVLIIFLTFSYFLYYVWQRFFGFQGYPSHLPWAGAGPDHGFFKRGKASWKSLFGLRELQVDGYQNYSKQEQPFILPNLLTGHELILPMSQMRWLQDQPDHILSQHETNKQFLCAEHTMLHPKIIGEARMGDFIRRELTRDLDTHAKSVVDEIELSLEEYLGSDSAEWREISLYDVMLRVIGRLVNRVLVGEPLCRDSEYLHYTTSFGNTVVITAGVVNLLPSLLKSILGPLVTAYDRFQYRKLARIIEPIVRERLVTLGPGVASSYKQDSSQPNDFIQWALLEAFTLSDPAERTPDMISKRLAVLGFAAIQSSAITITNALFDIAASPDSMAVQQDLRIEAHQTAAKNVDSAWTRASLARMVRTDSVLRESLRRWGFVTHGVTKTVTVKEGITLPSGEYLPYMAKCGIAAWGPHHDEKAYANPYAFEPFRFCQDASTQGSQTSIPVEGELAGKEPSYSNTTPKSFVTTSDYYMGFSHGRHACPGRFFASQQLKLLLANIMMKYDIEPITSGRPENHWLNNTIGPPIWATLRVRRRQQHHVSPGSHGENPVTTTEKRAPHEDDEDSNSSYSTSSEEEHQQRHGLGAARHLGVQRPEAGFRKRSWEVRALC